MKSIFHIVAMVAVSVFAVSCMKDPMLDDMSWSGDECSLSMDVGFTAFGTALDTRATGGTPGDAIGEVYNMQVLFYSNEGTDNSEESAELKYVFTGTPTDGGEGSGSVGESETGRVYSGTFTFTRTDENRTSYDGPTPETGISGTSTRHMTFRLGNVERGRYRIYVVANMPAEFSATRDANTVNALRNYKLNWNADNIAANNAMFGYFCMGDASERNVIYTGAPIIPVSGPMKMHAWLKRAVSKVTVAFDGTRLAENVYIYIKSVQIKDIPKTCLLGAKNEPDNADDLITQEIGDASASAKIIYSTAEGPAGESITTGNPRYPRPNSGETVDQWKARIHDANAENSLFFFENAQKDGTPQTDPSNPKDPDGSYKPQTDENNDGIPDDNQNTKYGNDKFKVLKDNCPFGTYIEVKAYYVNNNNYEVSRGDIVYRFMLGKDIYTSFDAERSIHYKVTLQFNNNANDVDWHIEINEDPGIYVPETYYVSYNYNEATKLPIRIVGKMDGRLKAEIIENNWGGPTEMANALNQYNSQVWFGVAGSVGSKQYTIQTNGQGQIINGICNGFLQLRKLKDSEKFEIGANKASNSGDYIKFNENYWYTNGKGESTVHNYGMNLGVREYDNNGFGNEDADNYGEYDVLLDGETMSFNIPLYTRQMKLMSTTGYSGANPYYSIEGTREAKIRFTATVNGERQEKIVTILQRPRIENPTGIWRAWDNTEPFNVTLQYRETESATSLKFSPVHSIGPWTATVTQGTDFITLDVLENGRKDSDSSIHGFTDTDVKFKVNFNSKCNNAKDVRCGIITVTYHNNSCTHHIFVRQGYAPIRIVDGGAKWHSFNLYTSGQETESPCEEGSMFRPGNLEQPISEVNNTIDNFNKAAGTLTLASGGTATWDRINAIEYTAKLPAPFGENPLTVSNHEEMGYTNGRIPIWKDFKPLIKSDKVKIAFGVLYADGATQENDDIEAFTYTRGGSRANGMRGIFIYNIDRGDNIFLPIGKSGYGRRRGNDGILRYANREAPMTLAEARYRPLLYSIYTNEGAIYWSGKHEHQNGNGYSGCSEGVVQGDFDNSLNPNYAFDINYKTYDLNAFAENQGTGACYIRLVSD